MRVIAGSARRLLLKTIEGMDTRPTTDRIKETLFNMLKYPDPGLYFSGPVFRKRSDRYRALSLGRKTGIFCGK